MLVQSTSQRLVKKCEEIDSVWDRNNSGSVKPVPTYPWIAKSM